MNYQTHSHRFADIILNSDYGLKQEIEEVIHSITIETINEEYEEWNKLLMGSGKKPSSGKQSTINRLFRDGLSSRGWEVEKNVFNSSENDLVMDFWKRKVGIDVAFNHRSSIGGDLLRLQAAAEVKDVINVGVYICPTREFARVVSPKDGNSMVVFERVQWYLENFKPVLTAPILLMGLSG